MAIKPQIKTLRAHKVAALVVDARLYARRTPEEACALLGWNTEHLEDLETAAVTPTLPELEALAAIYAVPVDHFFGSTSLSDEMPKLRVETMRQRLELRNRILGAMIMQMRGRRNLSRDDLSMATNLSIEQITQYELGQEAIPVTDLEDITRMLQINVFDWIDSYAIPTRDMIFKPYKITEQVSQPPVGEPETAQPPVDQVEQEVVQEPESIQDQLSQSQIPQQAIPEPVKREEKTVPIQTIQTSVQETSKIELPLDENLPKDLVEFISNPVNKQYLLLASNLSHMPADQLRRIAESLLEITF